MDELGQVYYVTYVHQQHKKNMEPMQRKQCKKCSFTEHTKAQMTTACKGVQILKPPMSVKFERTTKVSKFDIDPNCV